MKIVTTVRCFNEEDNIDRFISCYWFSDKIIISDGGSTDKSLQILEHYKRWWPNKIEIIHFNEQKTVNGQLWNDDNPHIQYVIDAGKAENPDWIIFDDMDCVPNYELRKNARKLLEVTEHNQANAFRLYMWGDTEYFPLMSNFFDPNYVSLWAWKPAEKNIYANQDVHHGTILGLDENHLKIMPPLCLLHKSWHPDTIEDKIARYRAVGIDMNHPLQFAGAPTALPEWAREYEIPV